jgi:hypothetical protein
MQGMPGWMKWTISLLIGIAIVLIGFRFAGWLLTHHRRTIAER